MKKAKVLILGGGFGGVRAALDLARAHHFDVELISDRPDFRYYPALYHYAVGGSHLEAAIPLDQLMAGRGVQLVIDKAATVDAEKKTVLTANGDKHSYDYLIVALGNVTNYFGIPGLEKLSYGIKSIEEADELRRHLHEELLDDKKPDLNYVVVGGGPTGVELAAALGHYLHRIMRMHQIDSQNFNVDLVEAADRVLPRMPADVSRKVQRRLEKLGVKLYLGTQVQAETADELKFKDESLKSKTVVWTAGVTNNQFFKDNAEVFKLGDHSKVAVDDYLSTDRGIYVIGDNAATRYSGLAQTAIYDADFVTNNLERKMAGRRLKRYRPKAPVSVVPVGHGWAAVLWGNMRIYGRTGWWLRRLADLVAYLDIESLGPAWRSWRADARYEETCPICAKQTS